MYNNFLFVNVTVHSFAPTMFLMVKYARLFLFNDICHGYVDSVLLYMMHVYFNSGIRSEAAVLRTQSVMGTCTLHIRYDHLPCDFTHILREMAYAGAAQVWGTDLGLV